MYATIERIEVQKDENIGFYLYKVYVEETYETLDGYLHYKPRRIFNIYDREEIAEAVVNELNK